MFKLISINIAKLLPFFIFLFSFQAFSQMTEYDLLRANANYEWRVYMDRKDVLLDNISKHAETTQDKLFIKDLKKSFISLKPLFEDRWISTYEVKTRYKKAYRFYKKAIRKKNRRN